MPRRVTLVLTRGGSSESTATAVKLADRMLARGHRVTVFAHDDAVTLTAGSSVLASAVAALVRRGLHGGTLDWVIDTDAARRLGVLDRQVPGVVPGDYVDLWSFVRAADVVLTPGAK